MDEGKRDRILDRTVDVLMALRTEFVMANPRERMKQWDRIESSARWACRYSVRMDEWMTTCRQRLRLGGNQHNSTSSALMALADEVDADDRAAIRAIETGLAMLIARCKLLRLEGSEEESDGN